MSTEMNAEEAAELLVGRRIVEATTDSLILDDGTRLTFETSTSECCSSIDLVSLRDAAAALITNAKVLDNEEETGGEGGYRAWIHVITDAGEFTVAEADGDASNGYYLHGFALNVTVSRPGEHGSLGPIFAELP